MYIKKYSGTGSRRINSYDSNDTNRNRYCIEMYFKCILSFCTTTNVGFVSTEIETMIVLDLIILFLNCQNTLKLSQKEQRHLKRLILLQEIKFSKSS